MNAFRRARHQAIYDWDDDAALASADETAGIDDLAARVGRMITLGHAWLTAHHPSIASALQQEPGG